MWVGRGDICPCALSGATYLPPPAAQHFYYGLGNGPAISWQLHCTPPPYIEVLGPRPHSSLFWLALLFPVNFRYCFEIFYPCLAPSPIVHLSSISSGSPLCVVRRQLLPDTCFSLHPHPLRSAALSQPMGALLQGHAGYRVRCGLSRSG